LQNICIEKKKINKKQKKKQKMSRRVDGRSLVALLQKQHKQSKPHHAIVTNQQDEESDDAEDTSLPVILKVNKRTASDNESKKRRRTEKKVIHHEMEPVDAEEFLESSVDCEALATQDDAGDNENGLNTNVRMMAPIVVNDAINERVDELAAQVRDALARADAADQMAGKVRTAMERFSGADKVTAQVRDAVARLEAAEERAAQQKIVLDALRRTLDERKSAVNDKFDTMQQRVDEFKPALTTIAENDALLDTVAGEVRTLSMWRNELQQNRSLLDRLGAVEKTHSDGAERLERAMTRIAALERAQGDARDTHARFERDVMARINSLEQREKAVRLELEQHQELVSQCEHLFNSLQTVQERVDSLDDLQTKFDSVVAAHAEMRAKLSTLPTASQAEFPHTPASNKTVGGGTDAGDSTGKSNNGHANSAPNSGNRKATPLLDQAQNDTLPLSVVSYVTREVQLLRQSLEAKWKLTSQPLVGPSRQVIRKLEGQFK
jgi:hypothetical protein